MRRTLFAVALISLALGAQAVPQSAPQNAAPQPGAAPQRKIPCKTPENATMCYWTRGRLQRWTGAGSWKMWKVGTKRIVTILSAGVNVHQRTEEEVQNPDFPPNLDRAFQAEIPRLKKLNQFMFDPAYADYEICPLEPERKGASQAVCIESAKNIFFDGSKRLYR